MRLIDADALLAAYPDCRGLKSKVDAAPTVKAKNGKWINEQIHMLYNSAEYDYECSECGGHTGYYSNTARTPFCPWCGTRMDGE